MLKFYYTLAPNPRKVALFLEEAGLPYDAIPVDTRKGEQHTPEYLAINPNAKVPAIVDDDGTQVFDSSAVLLYLAEKTGRFLPAPPMRGELLSWLMFTASGIGPYTGQAIHFTKYAPERIAYAVQRYEFEAWRHWRIIDARLADRRWMMGDDYTIVDMAVWGWGKSASTALGENCWERLPNLKRLLDAIDERPAAARAMALKERYSFKSEMDAQAREAMFPHMRSKAA
ncbi:glutathione S-transferase N-terminal domain-containing protein [Variovorax defluvii]|uniref:Glutathione S-transferase N-terminal domain-containing protein n=1 Tax=Variovorax defluvii TaxID=913761 RepID=A0ABP8I8W9_9BURK